MKIVLLGDSDVGKTTLLTIFTTNTSCLDKISDLFNVYTRKISVNSVDVDIECWNTSATESSTSRRSHFQDAAAIVICFAVDNVKSFTNAKGKWYEEARTYASDTPIYLVGTKSDKRNATDVCEVVSSEMGENARDELQAVAYMESSCWSCKCIRKIFKSIAKAQYARLFHNSEAAPNEHSEESLHKSWMKDERDVELLEEAIQFGAPRDQLRSKFSAALYLDTFRVQGHKIRATPAWVITREDLHIFQEALRLKCTSVHMASKQRVLLFMDQKRAEGRKVHVLPTWVSDEPTREIYSAALARRAPPRVLNTQKATKLFLMGVDDVPRVSSWFNWW